MKKQWKGFISGVLTTVLVLSLIKTATATVGQRIVDRVEIPKESRNTFSISVGSKYTVRKLSRSTDSLRSIGGG